MTTDNQEELFDVVDKNDNIVGQATRGEVHGNKKLMHRSVGVFVFNTKGELFLQKRSATKDTDPLLWTISCSGHVSSKVKSQKLKNTNQKAKIYEEAAHRELKEELGMEIHLEKVAKYICRAPNETEMVMLFRAKSDGPFRLQKEEISEGKFFTRKALKEALRSQQIRLSFMGKAALRKIGWL